jgi:hypothetical protein
MQFNLLHDEEDRWQVYSRIMNLLLKVQINRKNNNQSVFCLTPLSLARNPIYGETI